MIIKFSKIISCSSEHPSYPAKNLLEYRSSIDSSTWLCAKPGQLESEVVFQLAEPAPVTGVDIGNSRCCSVKIAGWISARPNEWVTIIEHEFMSHRDADDGRFKDQVQLFTKKEMNQETVKLVFERVKVTCSQPVNLKVLFGLSFLILRTEDKVDGANLDAFGRFKVKQTKDDSLDKFKEKYLQQIRPKPNNFKAELAKQIESKRVTSVEQIIDEPTTRKRPSLRLEESSSEPEATRNAVKREEKRPAATESERPSKRTKLSDKNTMQDNSSPANRKAAVHSDACNDAAGLGSSRQAEGAPNHALTKDVAGRGRARCSLCLGNEENVLCKTCNLLVPEKEAKVEKAGAKQRRVKPVKKPVKEFKSLFEGVAFSLSGYKNPERDEIRRKAIAMGAKYVVDTSRRNHGCTHLICAFKNTPKYSQLKGSAKIVSHRWIETCYDKKTRFPWRRFALDSDDKNEPESEDEVAASTGPPEPPSIYDQDTDSDY